MLCACVCVRVYMCTAHFCFVCFVKYAPKITATEESSNISQKSPQKEQEQSDLQKEIFYVYTEKFFWKFHSFKYSVEKSQIQRNDEREEEQQQQQQMLTKNVNQLQTCMKRKASVCFGYQERAHIICNSFLLYSDMYMYIYEKKYFKSMHAIMGIHITYKYAHIHIHTRIHMNMRPLKQI